MIKHHLLLLIGAICLLAVILPSCKNSSDDNEPATLKFNFTPGVKYHYTITSKESLEPEIKGGSLSITQNRIIESTFTVTPAGNNNKKLVFSIDRIAITAGSNNITALSYDSRNGAAQANNVFQNIDGLLNKPYNAIVSNTGNLRIDNTDPLPDSTAGNQLGAFNNASVNAMLNDLFNIFPAHPIKPGETWQKSFNTTIGFVNVKADNNYRLASVTKGIASIDVNSNITTLPSDSVDVNMKGVQIGNMSVDLASGLIINCDMKAHINGDIRLGINTQAGLSSEVHISGKKG